MVNIKNYYFLNFLFFLFIFFNFFSGWGFQILNIFNFPITYLFLIFFLMNIQFNNNLAILKELNLSKTLVLFFFYNFIILIKSFNTYGLMSLRDASYILDFFFLLFGMSFIYQNQNPILNLIKYFKILLPMAMIFLIIYIFKNNLTTSSITVFSPTGRSADFLFNFSTLQYMWIFFGLISLFFVKNKKISYILFFILTISSIIFFPKRINYLWITLIFIFLRTFNKEEFFKTFKSFIFLIFTMLIVEILFQNNNFNVIHRLDFIYNHFLSSFPGFETDDEFFLTTSGTAQWRYYYFKMVLTDILSSPTIFLFGKGFGVALTDFNVQGINVRDPHNMYLSVFARTGLIGLLIFLVFHIKILLIFIENLKIQNIENSSQQKKIILLLFIFYIYYLFPAGLTSAVLSSTFISSIIYLFIGINIAIYSKNLYENYTNSQ